MCEKWVLKRTKQTHEKRAIERKAQKKKKDEARLFFHDEPVSQFFQDTGEGILLREETSIRSVMYE